MIEYRLQFFAKEGPGGEKTEKPTAKKLEDARKEGQVVKSREVSNNDRTFCSAEVISFFSGGSVFGQL